VKYLVSIVLICTVFSLPACGGSDSDATTQSSTTVAAQGSAAAGGDSSAQPEETSPGGFYIPKQPKVRVPRGPEPTGLVVRDIKKGSGSPLVPDAKFAFRYVGVEYDSGKTFETRWAQPFVIQKFGNGELLVGQERGMRGMRVGGRRELIIPEHLGYNDGTGPLIYVIELVSVTK